MNFFRSSTKTYFKESPFRSLRFDAVTVILLLFVSSGVRAMQSQPTILKVSQAILGLVLMPVAVWVLMLLVHWEIRGVVQELDIPAKATTHLHWARLAGLHSGLVLGVTVLSHCIIRALMTAIR